MPGYHNNSFFPSKFLVVANCRENRVLKVFKSSKFLILYNFCLFNNVDLDINNKT